MRNLQCGILLVICASLFISCEDNGIQSETITSVDSSFVSAEVTTLGDTLKNGNIKLYPLKDSPLFEDAILSLNSPNEGTVLKNNIVNFNYDIKNFELSKPTQKGSSADHCANSVKGQHIHLILNNEPYQALYDTEYSDTLKAGHYVALSFLSRSYHESIKHYEAYDLRQFTVGDKQDVKTDLTKPLLFYSRPKGEYKGVESKKIVLDFYVVNAHLAVNDYKVKVTINEASFILTDWSAYIIEGLPKGSHTIKIELLDKNNHVANSSFNTIERIISIAE